MNRFLYKKESINIFYIPALILFIVFVIYPLFYGMNLSFTNWNGYSSAKSYVGLENYLKVFKDSHFNLAIKNTLIYGFGSTFLQQILGLSLALILNTKIKGKNIFRAVAYFPVLVSPVIMGSMYFLLFDYNSGGFNDIVSLFGIEKVAWLSSSNTAILIIVLVNTVQFFGISMVLYLAGLQGIPQSLYEAASVEGANAFQKFKSITLPLLSPAIITSLTLNLIGGLKLFDVILVMTGGGPGYSTNSISTLIRRTYFSAEQAGYASAMGIILFFMILLITILSQSFMRKGEDI